MERRFRNMDLTQETIQAFLSEKAKKKLTAETLADYRRILLELEKFVLPTGKLQPDTLQQWKCAMQQEGILAERTISHRISVVNQYFAFLNERNWQVSVLCAEKRPEPFLERAEYVRLLQAAKKQGKEQLYFLMKTICVLGITTKELPALTIEWVAQGGGLLVHGKSQRMIYLPQTLQKELMGYCRRQKIETGSIFVTRRKTQLHRANINAAMKQLCAQANVSEEKINPRCLWKLQKDTMEQLQEKINRLLLQSYESLLEQENTYAAWEDVEL